MNTPPKERFINPFTDFGFKKLFGEEKSKAGLIDFLNQLLPPEAQIETLSFSRNEHFGRHESDRRAVFDLYCEDEKGRRFIVEMQKAEQRWFKDRSVYYASFPIQEQAVQGKWDYQLQPVYMVGILDFVFDEDRTEKDKYLYHIKLSDIETHKVFYDKLTFVYLEAPKFHKTLSELNSRFEKWVYFLKHLSELSGTPPEAESDPVFGAFFEQAKITSLSQEERGKYEESLKVYRDLKNTMDYAKEDAFDRGRIEGKIEGKIETARTMIAENFPIEQIARLTGLSVEEVERIRRV